MKAKKQNKWYCFYSLIVPLVLLLAGCEKSNEDNETINEEDIKNISTTIGHYIVENLNQQNISLDIDSFIQGVEEAKFGQQPPLTQTEFTNLLASYRKKAFDLKSSENLKLAEDYLEDNRKDPRINVIESGKLHYKILQRGLKSSQAVSLDTTPLIHYEGRFIDGQVFDSTKNIGSAVELNMNLAIEGFKKGIQGMKEGEKRRLFIHPDLGYHSKGRIPPNSLLIFDVEILVVDVVSQKNPNLKDSNTSWIKRLTGS